MPHCWAYPESGAIVAASYFLGLTPGQVFVQDDFAAYVTPAANLVGGPAVR